MYCKFCNQLYMDNGAGEYCSTECKVDYQTEQNNYLDWYDIYMTGADIPVYEKIKRKKEKNREM